MKFRCLIAFASLAALPCFAADSFPGLKQVLSESEWKRAGLDRLTADELGVIDAALIRHHGAIAKQQEDTLREVRATATAAAAPMHKSLLERFGLPTFDEADWRKQPPLQAKVTGWESANRFKLDNGQVWEGVEPITYELVGKDIEISARPHGQFALGIEGKNTTLRVMRLR